MRTTDELRHEIASEERFITKQREKPFSFYERDKIKQAKKRDPSAGLN